MPPTYREQTKPWYGTARWKARRADQLTREPLCAMCLAVGRTTAATVADHIEPHKGNADLFWYGSLQSLCKPCHDGDKKRIEQGSAAKPTIGVDGWPITPTL